MRLPQLTQHAPEPNKHLVRFFGWYSNKTRGLRARTTATGAADPGPTPAARTARRRWAALIKRIWQVDPLACPRCGGPMKILSFINPWQRDVIDRILDHCGLSSRATPCEARGAACAADPWQDGPPPKDGKVYFVLFTNGWVGVVYWNEGANKYADKNYNYYPITVFAKHAPINLPKE